METFGKTELAKKTGVPKSTIPHFEKKLGLNVQRNKKGQRLYSEDHVILFKEIRKLRDKEIPFEEIKKILISQPKQEKPQETITKSKQDNIPVTIEDILKDSRTLITVPADMLKELSNGNESQDLEKENQKLKNELSQAQKRIKELESKLNKFSSLAGELISLS